MRNTRTASTAACQCDGERVAQHLLNVARLNIARLNVAGSGHDTGID